MLSDSTVHVTYFVITRFYRRVAVQVVFLKTCQKWIILIAIYRYSVFAIPNLPMLS